MQVPTAELNGLKDQLAELTAKTAELEAFNNDLVNKLDQEQKIYQALQGDNRHFKETLRLQDIALQERETAIVERDRYIDQLEVKVKQMHADITKKDMMLKQAQDHARTANSKGLNPMNRYMGQARSDSFSSDDDDDDSSFSQDIELN